MKKFIVVITSVLLSTGVLFAYGTFDGSGGFSGEYLTTFSASCRAIGMGKAYNAIANDSGGLYWHPGGLPLVTSSELSMLYTKLFGESVFNYVGFVHPFGNRRTLGIGRVGLDSPEAKAITALDSPAGTFQDKQTALFLSYGQGFGKYMNTGLTVKIVTQSMSDLFAIGYGIDAGLVYASNWQLGSLRNIRLGAGMHNLIQPSLDKDAMPTNLKTGVAFNISDKWLYALDINMLGIINKEGVSPAMRWHTGAEYKLSDMFAIRAGLDYKEISAGFGVNVRRFQFDYAVAYHSLGITHRIGITGRFAVPLDEAERKIKEEEEKLKTRKEIYNRIMAATGDYIKENYSKASTELKIVLALDPTNPEAKELLNRVTQEENKAMAKRTYNQAVEFYKNKNYREAREILEKVVRVEPANKNAQLYLHLSNARIALDETRYRDSSEILVQALEIEPDNKEIRDLLERINSVLELLEEEKK